MISPWSYTSSDGSDYQKAVRRVVKRKLAKYRKLAEAKRPLVIVLYNINDWLDLDDFDEIFFGSVAFDVDWDTRRPINLRREGAVMNPAFNRSLSAVLVKDIGQLNRYFLIENPFAHVPLGDLRDPVIRAFNATPYAPVRP
jgi:hypothetical protein